MINYFFKKCVLHHCLLFISTSITSNNSGFFFHVHSSRYFWGYLNFNCVLSSFADACFQKFMSSDLLTRMPDITASSTELDLARFLATALALGLVACDLALASNLFAVSNTFNAFSSNLIVLPAAFSSFSSAFTKAFCAASAFNAAFLAFSSCPGPPDSAFSFAFNASSAAFTYFFLLFALFPLLFLLFLLLLLRLSSLPLLLLWPLIFLL